MKRRSMTRSAAALAALAILAVQVAGTASIIGGLGALGGLAGLAGCVLNRTDQAGCRSDVECQEAFGLGTTCNGDGFCQARSANPRCETYPADLTDPERAADYKDHVIFGSISPYENALFEQFALSARLALLHINDRGGIDGSRGFGLIMCDAAPAAADGYDDGLATSQEAAVALARYLIDVWSVPAIFGPARSSEVEQVFLDVRDEDVLVISASATSPTLFALDATAPTDQRPGLLWRTAPPDELQTQAIAVDMITPGQGRTAPVDRVAVIYINDAYGAALYGAFAAAFETGGGQDAQAFPYSATDTGEQLPEVVDRVAASATFDEVLFVSSTPEDFVSFLDAIAGNPAFDGKGIFLSEAAASAEVLDQADPARFPQVRGSRPRPLDPNTDTVYETFLAEYEVEYATEIADQVFTANAYDAAWMLAAGALWAVRQENGNVTGTTIARGLRKLSAGPEVIVSRIGWSELRSSFEQGLSVDIQGASGALDYDPATEETESPIQIWGITASKTIQELDVWTPPP
jgi:branched-chain amino acid transport system substrate-binding protein